MVSFDLLFDAYVTFGSAVKYFTQFCDVIILGSETLGCPTNFYNVRHWLKLFDKKEMEIKGAKITWGQIYTTTLT